jgi:LmbE family N-acetylglucosaminyl deacetylase
MSNATITPPARALAVAAHPDDIEFMCGATMAAWARAGADITYLLLTDGAAGSRDPAMTHENLVRLRQQEQRAAAAACGVHNVIFLGNMDGRLQATLDVRMAIARVIRQVRPDAVICGDPTQRWSHDFGYINHPDHIAAGDATLAAIMPTANTLLAAPELLAEGLEPHDVGIVYISSWGNATAWMPLTEGDLQAKIAALREHHSQLAAWDPGEGMREWATHAAATAREHGVVCDLAEGFIRIALRTPEPAAKESGETTTVEAAATT